VKLDYSSNKLSNKITFDSLKEEKEISLFSFSSLSISLSITNEESNSNEQYNNKTIRTGLIEGTTIKD
jgi:hypothetical protein